MLSESFGRMLSDDRGNSFAEYAIIAVAFAMIVMVTLNSLAREASTQLSSTQLRLTNTASMATPQMIPSGVVGQ
jgi:Flp pilus assembly pilin Flp